MIKSSSFQVVYLVSHLVIPEPSPRRKTRPLIFDAPSSLGTLCRWVGVHLNSPHQSGSNFRDNWSPELPYLPLSAGHGNVHESSSVSDPFLRSALGSLLLLLRFDLLFACMSPRFLRLQGRHILHDHTFGVCDLTFPARARDP